MVKSAHPDHADDDYSVAKVDTWLANLVKEFKLFRAKSETESADKDNRIKKLEEKVEALEKKNSELLKRNANSDNSNSKGTALDFSKINWSTSKASSVIVNQIDLEKNERSKRENNLFISGLELTLDDGEKSELSEEEIEQKIMPIFKEIDNEFKRENIKKTTKVRINRNKKKGTGPSNDSPTKVNAIIEFSEKASRDEILKNSKVLVKNCQYKSKVFINPDLTRAQRMEHRDLRIKAKELNSKLTETIQDSTFKYGKLNNGKYFFWGIRDGILKKITIDK
jgi:hypothetical protein